MASEILLWDPRSLDSKTISTIGEKVDVINDLD